MTDPFASATGKGVKIAVIDDGIYPHHASVKNLMAGVGFEFTPPGEVLVRTGGFADSPASHGTLCAALISRRVPDAQLYSLQVLDQNHSGHPLSLVKALEWAIEHGIDIVNISLGTTSQKYVREIHHQCAKAAQAGMILVAATHASGLRSYPSAFSETINVGQDDQYIDYQYGHAPGRIPEFLASGQCEFAFPQPVPDSHLTQGVTFSKGTSISAARMSANAAAIRQTLPVDDVARFRDELSKHAIRVPRWRRRVASKPSGNGPPPGGEAEDKPIGKVAVYSCDGSTTPLIASHDSFPFRIHCVIDPAHPSRAGKDAGITLGRPHAGIPIMPDLDDIPAAVKTLIVGDLDALGRAERRDPFYEVARWGLSHDKNVIALGPVCLDNYANLAAQYAAKQLRLQSAASLMRGLELTDPSIFQQKVDVPVIGVFGTSFNQGKFPVQLGLRRCLQKHGYRVSLVGANPLCALLRDGYYINQDSRSAQCLSTRDQIALWEIAVAAASVQRPDLILVGGQGGVVPVKLYRVAHLGDEDDQPASDLPGEYSLPALTTLMAGKLDAAILVVNCGDSDEHVRRSITVTENIGQTSVIALAMTDKLAMKTYKYTQRWGRELSADEREPLRRRFTDTFNLPMYCLQDAELEQLARHVIDSFESDEP